MEEVVGIASLVILTIGLAVCLLLIDWVGGILGGDEDGGVVILDGG